MGHLPEGFDLRTNSGSEKTLFLGYLLLKKVMKNAL